MSRVLTYQPVAVQMAPSVGLAASLPALCNVHSPTEKKYQISDRVSSVLMAHQQLIT